MPSVPSAAWNHPPATRAGSITPTPSCVQAAERFLPGWPIAPPPLRGDEETVGSEVSTSTWQRKHDFRWRTCAIALTLEGNPYADRMDALARTRMDALPWMESHGDQ